MTLNELDLLKQKADLMGIPYKSNIGVEALKAKINAKLDDKPDPGDGAEGDGSTNAESTGTEQTTTTTDPVTSTDPVASAPVTEQVQHAPTNAQPAVSAERIQAAAAVVQAPTPTQQDPVVTQPKTLTKLKQEQAFREQMATEQMALVRCRITCLNPLKREIKGEIITVANKYLGTVRKFIPFGEQTDDGFHIPKVLFDELKSRKFNSVTTKKGPNGQRLPISRMVPEFAIEVLPQLSEDELADLAAAQAAAAGG